MLVLATICPSAVLPGAEFSEMVGKKRRASFQLPERDENGDFVNCLSFNDAERCQTRYIKSLESHARVFDTPLWALSTEAVRAVLLEYFERRVFSKTKRAALTGDTRERLLAAIAALKKLGEILSDGRAREVNRLSACSDSEQCRAMNEHIAGLATQIRLTQRPDAFLQIIHDWYGAHLTMREVADRNEVPLKTAETFISRVNKIAHELGYVVGTPSRNAGGDRYKRDGAESAKTAKVSPYSARKKDGLCIKCGGARDTALVRCSVCQRKKKESWAASHERRLKENLCTKCGGSRGSVEGVMCAACLQNAASRRKSVSVCPS